MITDHELLLSDNQLILDTGASTSYVDTLAAGDAIAPGARVVAKISTAYVDVAGGTIIATLQTDSDPGFAVANVTLLTGPTITIAAGVATSAGAVGVTLMDKVIPAGVKRYLRMYYTFGAAMDSGGLDARIVLDSDKPVDKGL